MTIVEFLLARIAEDEAVARSVIDGDFSEGHWRWDSHRLQPYRSALVNDRDSVVLPPKNDDVYPSASVAVHIARHDPARVLAECAAKRAIVGHFDDPDYDSYPLNEAKRTTLRSLAAVYADHPDCRQEWKL